MQSLSHDLPDNFKISGKPAPRSRSSLQSAIAFGLFVFWLLSLPMEGPLLEHSPDDRHLFLFLVPHVIGLLLAGRFWPAGSFPRASLAAIPVTIALTIAIPLLPGGQGALLAVCGAISALISIRAGMLVHQARRPILAAAAGLAIGNLLLLLLLQLSSLPRVGPLLAAMALMGLLMGIRPSASGALNHLTRYLPAVFVFQLVSGLMYRFLMPAYADHAFWNGIELFFYLAAVLLALSLLARDRELLLVLGVILALGAFLCLRGETPLALNLSMFGMQGAAGCVDMFLIACMLDSANSQRAFGIGNSVLCAGILAGAVFNNLFGDLTGPTIVLSQIALNGAVLILYLQNRRFSLPRREPASLVQTSSPEMLPDSILLPLSPQEQQVLELVRQGKTYREVGTTLAISESSVKTYMNRIFSKLGATNKKNLLRILTEHQNSSIPAKWT